jgi:septum site-determining protein MinC
MMTANTADSLSTLSGSMQSLEFKGRMMMVSLLRLKTLQALEMDEALHARMAEAPDLMRKMPIVLDLGQLGHASLAELLVVIERVRRHGFKLIGLQECLAASEALLEASGLPLLALGNGDTRPPGSGGSSAAKDSRETAKAAPSVETAKSAHDRGAVGMLGEGAVAANSKDSPSGKSAPEEGQSATPVHSLTTVIRDTVRSGQQVYARGGDLIILASVSSGAEILADGHIHIHGTLRGRALAGVRGLASATIYCRRLEAELLAIAGCYRVADDILDRERGEHRMVRFDGKRLLISET